MTFRWSRTNPEDFGNEQTARTKASGITALASGTDVFSFPERRVRSSLSCRRRDVPPINIDVVCLGKVSCEINTSTHEVSGLMLSEWLVSSLCRSYRFCVSLPAFGLPFLSCGLSNWPYLMPPNRLNDRDTANHQFKALV